MKQIARYPQRDGRTLCVEYDTDDPCRICGLPVVAASMGGTNVCSWCDCGYDRDGTPWDYRRTMEMIGPNSPAARYMREHPSRPLDETNLPPHVWFEDARSTR